MAKQGEFKIKAKDCAGLSLAHFLSLPYDKRLELIANHYLYKRRRLGREVVSGFIKNIDSTIVFDVYKKINDDGARRKFFRSIKNISNFLLNGYLANFSKQDLYEAINCLKLEDRRKISHEILETLEADKTALLLNEHFLTFGKLNKAVFDKLIPKIGHDKFNGIISALDSKVINHFFKAARLDDLSAYLKTAGFTEPKNLMDGIKGSIKLIVVLSRKDFLSKVGQRNKKNIILINVDLFKHIDLLNIEIWLQLNKIKLKQRKHISFVIEPLFRGLKYLHFLINLNSKKLNQAVKFLKSNYLEIDGLAYQFIRDEDVLSLSKIEPKKYNAAMQALFDVFYARYVKQYIPKRENDAVFKKKIKKLIACRFIEVAIDGWVDGETPFLFQFDSYLDADGRALLGYYKKDGASIEIRPTIKQFARSFARFRPRLNGIYDVFKINSKSKIIDFVPVSYQLSEFKFQHMPPGHSVAGYVKGVDCAPISFRSYLTADSKLYFGKINGEVVQTLISYLEGATPVECIVKRNQERYTLDIYILNSHTGNCEYKKAVRSICLRTEKPYFKELLYDFKPEMFLEMDEKSFNNSLRYFKKAFFNDFYENLSLDAKKTIYERLSSKGESALMDKIGEDKFTEDSDKLFTEYGEEIGSLSDIISDREQIDEKINASSDYVEFPESFSRRKSDLSEQDIADIDDESYFTKRETARIDEFGFDFTSYPPELTFKIKMEVLEKIYESFPEDLRHYIKIHADEVDEEIQEKILSIDPRLLDGIPLGKAFAVRKDPVKRSFINGVIKLFEDNMTYDKINDVIAYLRDSKIKIRNDADTNKFIVKSDVLDKIQFLVNWDRDKLIKNLSILVSDI